MIRVVCVCGQFVEVADVQAAAAACCPGCGLSVDIPRLGILVPSDPAAKAPKPAGPKRSPKPTPSVKPRRGGRMAALFLAGLAIGGTGYAFLRPGRDAAGLEDLPEAIYLAWKSHQPFRQHLTCETRQHFKSPRQEGEVSHQHHFALLWTPSGRRAGNWTFTQKLERVELQMKSGFQTIHFNSSGTAEEGTPLALTLREARLDFDIQPDGVVRAIKGTDDLLRKVEATAPDLYLVLEACLNAEAQKHLAESLFGALPNREVKAGASWVRQRQLPPMLGGRLAGPYRYTLAGADGRLARIRVNASLSFQACETPSPPAAGIANHLKGCLTGTIWFDPDKGRIARSVIERTIEGNVRISRGTEYTWVEVKNAQKAVVQITEP